jgi:hypothetical protein
VQRRRATGKHGVIGQTSGLSESFAEDEEEEKKNIFSRECPQFQRYESN